MNKRQDPSHGTELPSADDSSSGVDWVNRLKLAIFDQIPMPLWACDRNCKIVFWNDSAARLYGYSSEETLGRDFVDLFVNPAEAGQARADTVEIIDKNIHIRNRADDRDKDGITRKLITHCFPVYDICGFSGLQVEISYEIADIDRLQQELEQLQFRAERVEKERAELQRQLEEMTRKRALDALEAVVRFEREAIQRRETAANEAALRQNANQTAIELARATIKIDREKLIAWEKSRRALVMNAAGVDELDNLILPIEHGEGLHV